MPGAGQRCGELEPHPAGALLGQGLTSLVADMGSWNVGWQEEPWGLAGTCNVLLRSLKPLNSNSRKFSVCIFCCDCVTNIEQAVCLTTVSECLARVVLQERSTKDLKSSCVIQAKHLASLVSCL